MTDSVLGGDAGNDTFGFRDGSGNDTIQDLVVGSGPDDVIDLIGMGFTDLASVLAVMTQIGAGTAIDFGDGDSLTLVGVDKANLSQDDFALA